MSLPDCMMPDGGEACIAYHEAIKRIAELETERDAAFNKGMERAAEIAYEYNPTGSWGSRISAAIRKEIDK